MKINDSQVVKSYRVFDWSRKYPHMLRITEDRKIWLDCGGGEGTRCSHMGTIPTDVKLTDADEIHDIANL
jgi:hypothetical protein